MAMTTMDSLIYMATEAIEILLNKLSNNCSKREHERMAEENKQLRACVEHSINEQQKKNDALASENRRLKEQLSNTQRTTIKDTRLSQIQHFLEPVAPSEQEFRTTDHYILPQNKKPFAQRDDEEQKRSNQNRSEIRDIRIETIISEIDSDRNNLKAVHDKLAEENKELEKQLEYYEEQHEEELKQMETLLAELKARQLESFEDIEKHDKRAAETLIRLAKRAKPIGMEGINVGLFGITSTGKSTMLNALYGKKVAETGIGETTVKVTSYQTEHFTLWDLPGKNDELSYLSLQYISFFKGLSKRIILITHTLKENSGMMKFLDAIELSYDIVVNKMDQYEEDDIAAFCKKIKDEVGALKLARVNYIFFVSARFPKQFPDWIKMVDYLSSSRN